MNSILLISIIAFQATTLALLVFTAFKIRGRFHHIDKNFHNLASQSRSFYEQRVHDDLESILLSAQNSISLNHLNFEFPVFFGEWSIDSFLAKRLVQHVVEFQPSVILELGSGSSTILIAKSMKKLGLRDYEHISIDHEIRYLNQTKLLAELNGVSDRITFAECPLEELPDSKTQWYGQLLNHLEGKKIDLLIVDGPPGPIQTDSRYPALPMLLPFLSSNCTIFLDDTSRHDEESIAKRWADSFQDFELELVKEGHGHAILTRRTN